MLAERKRKTNQLSVYARLAEHEEDQAKEAWQQAFERYKEQVLLVSAAQDAYEKVLMQIAHIVDVGTFCPVQLNTFHGSLLLKEKHKSDMEEALKKCDSALRDAKQNYEKSKGIHRALQNRKDINERSVQSVIDKKWDEDALALYSQHHGGNRWK